MRAPLRIFLLLLALVTSMGAPDRLIAQQGAQTAVEAARELLDLPIEKALPEAGAASTNEQ